MQFLNTASSSALHHLETRETLEAGVCFSYYPDQLEFTDLENLQGILTTL